MVYKCKNCGAKLNIEKTDEIVTCEYCGSVSKIEFSTNDFYRNISFNTKKYIKVFFTGTSLMIIFGIVVFSILNRQNMSSISSENSGDDYYYGNFKYHYYQDGGYLIDIDGNDFLDVATVARNIEDNQDYLQILDGKTGERLNTLKLNKEKKPELFTINQNYVCIAKDDFTLTIYDKNLSEIKTFSLSDKLFKYKLYENKLFLETKDDNLQTIDLKTFTMLPEASGEKPDRRINGYNLVNKITDGDVTYIAEKKKKSSKNVFSIIAKKGNKELWKLPLGFEDVTWWGGPPIIAYEGTVITFGKKFTSDNFGYLIGIDKVDGRIKYEVKKSEKNFRLYDFYFNRRYVIVNLNGSYHAFDPNTGKTKWTVGSE